MANVIHHKHPDFIEKYPTVPWKYMRGMRNVIAHGYFELDFEVVYETAIHSIPELITQIDTLINEISA